MDTLASRGVPLNVLSSLPQGCLNDDSVRAWQNSVRDLVMVKNRRRLVSSTLIDVIRVLMMEMRMPYGTLEALTEVRACMPCANPRCIYAFFTTLPVCT